MAKPLNNQQQSKLSRIMAVPTIKTPSTSYQVTELGSPEPSTQTPVATDPVTQAVHQRNAHTKSSGNSRMVIFITIGILVLIGYLYFWLKYFKLI